MRRRCFSVIRLTTIWSRGVTKVYSATRLDKDLYNRVKTAGFKWAPKQELFAAPAWTPDEKTS
jgi:hypothetical protein